MTELEKAADAYRKRIWSGTRAYDSLPNYSQKDFLAGAQWALESLKPDQVQIDDLYDRVWDVVGELEMIKDKVLGIGEDMKTLRSKEKF